MIFQVDVKVGSFGAAFVDNLSKSLDPSLRAINKRYTVYYDFEEAFRNASERRLVLAEGDGFLEYNMRKRFTNE